MECPNKWSFCTILKVTWVRCIATSGVKVVYYSKDFLSYINSYLTIQCAKANKVIVSTTATEQLFLGTQSTPPFLDWYNIYFVIALQKIIVGFDIYSTISSNGFITTMNLVKDNSDDRATALQSGNSRKIDLYKGKLQALK